MTKNIFGYFVLAATVSAILCPRQTARAAGITIKGLLYPKVTIREAQGGVLTFQIHPSGKIKLVPLPQVDKVRSDKIKALTNGERMYVAQKWKRAVDAYEAVPKQTDQAWAKYLASIRLITCYDNANMFDKAVETWVNLVRRPDETAWLVRLRPANVPPRGAVANKRVIDLLKKAIRSEDAPAVRAPMEALLLKVYKIAEPDKAQDLAHILATRSKPRPRKDVKNGTAPPPPIPGAGKAAYLDGGLEVARSKIEAGQYDQALDDLDKIKPDIDPAHYPQWGALRGRALQGKEEWLEAGLAYMRVVIHFGDKRPPVYPQCLLGAAQVHNKMGRTDVAETCYNKLIQNFPDSPEAKTARKEIVRK